MRASASIARRLISRLPPREFFAMPPEWACKPTRKRRLNLILNRWEQQHTKVRLRSLPWILSIEPTNACNLRCPFCFTGAGGIGRKKSIMTQPLFERLLDELGDYLILLKACGWGEPLLCGHLDAMLKQAHERGICTLVNTNLSFDLPTKRAEALVRSGLRHLIVSIDGAQQESYQQYRVGGSLQRVVDNVQLLNDMKRFLRSEHPKLLLEFHPFPWNTGDIDGVRKMASGLEMQLLIFKGCTPGEEWGRNQEWQHCGQPRLEPCAALWATAVVSSDGGVSPCFGTFYSGDDMGRIDPSELANHGFRDVWNNERYRLARGFFRARRASAEQQRHVCFNCPNTILWERWKLHRDAGGTSEDFQMQCGTHETWNYFWNRRLAGSGRLHATPTMDSNDGVYPLEVQPSRRSAVGG